MENITLNHVITVYLQDLETRQPKAKKTLRPYRNTLRRFEALIYDSNVTLLKDVDEGANAFPYWDKIINQDYLLNTVNTYVMTMKAFMSYTVVKGWIASSPFAFVNVTGFGARRQSRLISRDQLLNQLYPAPNATLYNVFLMGGDACLRISEILDLDFKNIRFDSNEIAIEFAKGIKSQSAACFGILRSRRRSYIYISRKNRIKKALIY